MSAGQANREFELKFSAQPKDMQRFKRAVNAAGKNRRAWSKKTLVSRYFDTPDLHLRALGISARLRSSGDKTVQTIKARAGNGGGGVMDRHEWERVVEGETLVLTDLPIAARRAIGAVRDDELGVVMEVHIERQSMVIRRPNPLGPEVVIEAVADTGRVVAGEQEETFAECELELIEGDINAFFTVASEIHNACPLPMSSLTKAGRGYRLLSGGGPKAHRVPKFALTGKQTIHQALAEIYPVCIANIVENEDACLDGTDPEGVHQMRVSVRRLRTSLKVFDGYLDPARTAWMAVDLKWLGGALGPARDWDVYITETLEQVAGYGVDEKAVAALRSVAEEKRKAAYDAVRKTLTSRRYAKMIFHLTAFVAVEGWLAMPANPADPLLHPLEKCAGAILSKPHRKLLKQGKALEKQDTEARHEVRIRLKKLRYAVDFLRGVFPGKKTAKYVKSLQSLQDQFGHLNDVAQAMHMTNRLTASSDERTANTLAMAGGLIQGWYAHALKETEPALIKDWKAFSKTAPFWNQPPD
ncbi:MAG: CYTH and CHAD domain-containing protein [Rhodospirillales bacterium]|nr:CYTH and CHAD domain-containing protein [Rhodospirillales bacterium]MBO6787871.1 CYTH and CHAD domain-containing protein [Rhodospirillales bacterium]